MDEDCLYNIGIEREGLRCDEDGVLSKLPHPEVFGDRMKNNFITTDWGEAQMELRTPVCSSTKECYEKLNEITNVVLCELNDRKEFIWPYSMQCILPKEEDFPFGNYGTFEEEHEYEMYLYKKYGYKMHCMSGIHVNFSMNSILFEKIKQIYKDIPHNIDDAYFKIMRVFMKRAWILMYVFGATPIQIDSEETSKLSLRNSEKIGFKNNKGIEIDLTSKQGYIDSIKDSISAGSIKSAKEAYVPIRAKSRHKSLTLEELEAGEINHIEVRLCDINPFDKCGINKEQMDLTVLFLINCLTKNEESCTNYYYKDVAKNGLSEEQIQELINEFKDYREINEQLDLDFDETIEKELNKINSNSENVADNVIRICKEEGLLTGMLSLAKKYSQDAENMRYKLTGYPELEASTQVLIKDAISKGVDYKIIDAKKSFIELSNGNARECVVQASKTSKDSYIFPIITDDKVYAKRIMIENGVDTPACKILNKKMGEDKINRIIKTIVGQKVVIKPKTTNYGDGITIINNPATEENLKTAIEYAFTFDSEILVEEYIEGNEYRFLVINGKCLHVVWRRRASVVGDGVSNIKELISQKENTEMYKRFNRKIAITPPMLEYLEERGYSLEYVPPKDERVYLHKVSNASKGGEAVDVNDIVPEYYKRIAEKLVKAFNAKICGVDFIINDMDSLEYKVIELNDNPGILLNESPVEGKGIKVGFEILKLLGLIEK